MNSKNSPATRIYRFTHKAVTSPARIRLSALLLLVAMALAPVFSHRSTASAQEGTPATHVEIDILPGVSPNAIDLGSQDTIPVAILSTAEFDATHVSVNDLMLAGAQTVKNDAGESSTTSDVNGDALTDLVVYYYVPQLHLTADSAQASLRGYTNDGAAIEGSDSVSCTGAPALAANTGRGFGFTGTVMFTPGAWAGPFEAVYNYIASFFVSPAPAAAPLPAPTPVTTTTTSTGGSIAVPSSGSAGQASPYPSTIAVSGITGSIEKLTVSINGATHSSPPDLDILLVGPGGQKLLLMSDVGKETGPTNDRAITNASFTFDDAAAAAMVNGPQYTGGTFKPSNSNTPAAVINDPFNAPAPAGPYSSLLSVFNTTNANGTWSLYVMDDKTSDNGSIASWSLHITYTPTAADTTAPVTTAVPTGTNGNNGWYKSDVSLSLSATDGAPSGVTPSGVASTSYRVNGGSFVTYTVPVTVSTEGSNTVEYFSTDAAGNVEPTNSLTVKIDQSAPSISFGAPSPAANAAGWNNTNVSVPFTINDATSGADTSASTASPLSLTAEGAAVNGTVTAVDLAGNSATATSPDFKIDKTAPSISASRSPSANAFGWNNTDVLASYTASDALSGLAAGSPANGSHNFDAEGAGQSHTFTVLDVAGNEASATVSDVNIDKTAPTVTAVRDTPANANGWNNTAVSVSYTANDALSGVDAAASDVSPASLTTEGAGQSKTFTAYDKAGNAGTGTVSGINIDLTAPTINASRTPAANANGWNNTDVTASATASDTLSGLDNAASTLASVVFSAEAAGQSTTFTAVDLAGNSAAAAVSDVNIDKTAPVIAFGAQSPPANAFGWNNTDVSIPFTVTEALSGVDTASAPSPLLLDTEGANVTKSVTVTDKAGNSTTETSPAVKIDKTAPAVTASAAKADSSPYAASTWTNQSVTVSYHCTDGVSGVDSVSGPETKSGEGADQSASGTCTDKAGNNATATFGDIDIDKTAPTVTAVRDTPANANGWNNTAVSVSYTANDALSGVNVGGSDATPLSLSGEGAGQSHTFTVFDNAGNSATGTVSGINIDLTAPTITADRTPAANSDGWNNTDVTANYNASDALSGLDASSPATGSHTFSTEGANQTETFTVTDLAGNSASATVSDVNIDKTKPTLTFNAPTGTAGDNGWFKSNVTFGFTTADNLSGVTSPSFSSVELTTEGAAVTGEVTVTDKAGNSETFTTDPVKIDKTLPVITAQRDTPANANGWNNGNVLSSYSASDGGSGLASPATGSFTFTTEGANQSHTFTVTDLAGNSNSAEVSGVNIDLTKPTLTFGAPSPAANSFGWNNTDVSFSFTTDDDLSGVDATSQPSPVVLSTEGTAVNGAVMVTDKAGNSQTFTTASVKIDKTKPTVSLVSPTNGNYTPFSTVAASYSCADAAGGAPSGVDTCSGNVPSGSNMDTAPLGPKTFTVNVTDKAGNTNSESATYTLLYTFNGFFQPVDNLPMTNRAQAGSAIPVKFSLAGNQGLNIFMAGFPVSGAYPCSASEPLVDIEQTVTAGGSSLTYDPVANQYVYVWKTDKSWASSCRQLIVRLADGSERRANFQFRK